MRSGWNGAAVFSAVRNNLLTLLLTLGRYFGYEEVAATALDAILAFMPNVPNWAYNGAALGIGDFSNNAKETPYGGWERVLQHYRAGE